MPFTLALFLREAGSHHGPTPGPRQRHRPRRVRRRRLHPARHPTRFLGCFSTDAFGTLFRARLSVSGVDLTGSVTAPEPSTLAVAVADLDETGQATYTFYGDSAVRIRRGAVHA